MQSVILCYSIPQIPTDLPRGHGVQAGVAGWAEAFALVGRVPSLGWSSWGLVHSLILDMDILGAPFQPIHLSWLQISMPVWQRGDEATKACFEGERCKSLFSRGKWYHWNSCRRKEKKNWLQVNHRFGVLRHTAATSCTLTISAFCFLPCIQWLANYIDQLTEGEMFKSATGFFYTCGEIVTSQA